jgi:hypothetical protein
MKNLFIIPTDKPSRLVKFKDESKILISSLPSIKGQGYNIYITNLEEIKDGDWVYHKILKSVFKIDLREVTQEYIDEKINILKIILTTDQDLDGVQSIDDNFLEWFVKNPSCEEVEVQKFYGFAENYLIIIPKEELINCPKCRTTDFKNCHSVRCPMKKQELNLNCFDCNKSLQDCTCMEDTINMDNKETLEESMNENGYHDQTNDTLWREGVLFGVKWQQERMYSEEEVKFIINKLASDCYFMQEPNQDVAKWFEKNKKK